MDLGIAECLRRSFYQATRIEWRTMVGAQLHLRVVVLLGRHSLIWVKVQLAMANFQNATDIIHERGETMRRFTVLCLALMVGGSAAAMAADPPKQIQSLRESTNAAQHATEVTARLQKVGFTQVQNTTCSGEICEAQVLWENKPMKLRIELATGRVEAAQ